MFLIEETPLLCITMALQELEALFNEYLANLTEEEARELEAWLNENDFDQWEQEEFVRHEMESSVGSIVTRW